MKPKAPPKTHFICLPLRTPSFRNKVTAFNALLPTTVHPSIIRPPGSLHFTLGVMSLTTPDEIEAAVTFLRSCHADAYALVGGQSVTVRLKAIACMQKNIKNANVIYAVPDESEGNLRSLCDLLQSRFKEAEFLDNDKHSDQAVKLHCTLLNTLHMKPRPKKRKVTVLDATEIFESEELKEYDFGEVHIEEVQICEMGIKEVEGEIRYKSVGGFSLTSMDAEEKVDVVVASKDEAEAISEDMGEVVPEDEKVVGDVEVPLQHDSKSRGC